MNPDGFSGLEVDFPEYPCPVCGYLVLDEPPGSFAICPICFWEDDIVQLGFPLMAGGANRLSLHQAQQEFMRSGACEFRLTGHVRPATASDKRDAAWRPFDPASDRHLQWDSPRDSERWRAAAQNSCLYYWRQEYWLSPTGAA
jgi:Cysteine-rich CPCC